MFTKQYNEPLYIHKWTVLLVSTWPFPLFFQPYFTDQGTSGGIQPTIQCYSSSAFENQGNMHRTVSGTHRAQTPLISDLHDLLLWLVGHSDVLSILEITSVHPTSNSPWKFWLYPLSQYMVIWVKVIGPLGMIGWKFSNIQFWKYTGVLPQGDPAFPSFKCSGSVNWLKPKNWLRGHNSLLLWLTLDLFTYPRTLLLIQIK